MRNKNKISSLVFVIIFLTLFGGLIIYGIYIIPKQMAFNEACNIECLKFNKSYEVSMFSYLNKVNGHCYCKEIREINLNNPKWK